MSKFRFLSALTVLLLCQLLVPAQKREVIELPMLFRGPMPAVEVMVNGKGPFLFAIDTGAQGTARIDSSLVEKLGLKPSGQVPASDVSGQNVRMLDTYEVDSIKIGDLTFEKITAPSRNYNTSPNFPKVDGILAFNLFAEYLLTLDYPGKKVRLEKGALPAANGTNILEYDNSRQIPIVELWIGEQKVKAHIDSGNTIAPFILPAAVIEKAGLASEPVVVGRARTVSNEIEIRQARLKDTIRLGGFEFAEPTVNFPSISDANIGSRLLSEFSITFDQKNKRLKLERTKPASETGSTAATQNAKDYIGTYGERIVSEENGDLYIQRTGGMKLKLVNVSKDEFTLERVPGARLKFVREAASGKVIEIQVLNPQGGWEKAARQQS